MTKDEIITYLIETKVIYKDSRGYGIVKEKSIKQGCINLPDKYVDVSPNQAMNLFFEDADIPHFATGKLNYALRTITQKSLTVFTRILKNKSIDFSILVSRTSSYYSKEGNVKPAMSKYFTDNLWRSVYESYDNLKNLDNTTWV